KSELKRWEKSGDSVVILVRDEERMEKVQSILQDYQIEADISKNLHLPVEKPTITIGNISSGLEMPIHKLAVITENELFKKQMKRPRKRQKMSNAERIKNYQ